jgi:hypothetical protein
MAQVTAKVIKNPTGILFLLKLLIISSAFIFLYRKLFISNQFSEISEGFSTGISVFSLPLLALVPLLGIFNWGLEAFKWKSIAQKLQPLSFASAYKGVVSGITIGLVTPNRIGEYGGRVLYLKSENRIKGVVGAVTGNVSQLLVTLLFSFPGIILFFSAHELRIWLLPALLLFVVLFFLFFNVRRISGMLGGKFINVLSFLKEFSLQHLILIFSLSVLRYFIFLTQFYLLLLVFNVVLSLNDVFIFLPLVFLAISLIPGFALTEWGIRGSASLFFIGMVSSNTVGILAAAGLLWIVNIALPSIVGTMFLAKDKTLK